MGHWCDGCYYLRRDGGCARESYPEDVEPSAGAKREGILWKALSRVVAWFRKRKDT